MHVHLPASLSSCHTIHRPTPGHPLPVSFFAFVHFPRSLSPARSMLSYPTDNSIILHAKTASDVLAQSASHLCEQITSYRKTDFIFEEERRSWFFFRLSVLLDPSPRSIFPPLVLPLFFLSVLLYTHVQWGTKIGAIKVERRNSLSKRGNSRCLFCQFFDSVAVPKCRKWKLFEYFLDCSIAVKLVPF